MAANWNNPTISSLYTDVISELKARDVDVATQFKTLPTNPVTDMVRFNRTNSRWETYNGTSWVVLDSAYEINVTQLGGHTASYYTNAGNLNAGILPSARFNDTTHGNRGGGNLHSLASTSSHGFMSSSDWNKLNGIEAGATADQTPTEILSALVTVDGAGSGLDADTLDGYEATAFAKPASNATISGTWTYTSIPVFNGGASGTYAPFSVDSTYVVTNLNADLLDGKHASDFQLADANLPTFPPGITTTEIGYLNGVTSSIQGQFDNIQNQFNSKSDKVTGATNGNLAGLDASGNLTDSGVPASTVLVDGNIGTMVQGYDPDIPTIRATTAEMHAGTQTGIRSMSPKDVADAIAVLGGGGTLDDNSVTDSKIYWENTTTWNTGTMSKGSAVVVPAGLYIGYIISPTYEFQVYNTGAWVALDTPPGSFWSDGAHVRIVRTALLTGSVTLRKLA